MNAPGRVLAIARSAPGEGDAADAEWPVDPGPGLDAAPRGLEARGIGCRTLRAPGTPELVESVLLALAEDGA